MHRINLRNNVIPESKENIYDLQMSRKMSEPTSEDYHGHSGEYRLPHVHSSKNSDVRPA